MVLAAIFGYYETTLEPLVSTVDRICDEHGDKRVVNWFMMGSPWPTLIACVAYAFTMKVIGPKLMEKRAPFDLKRIMIIYNIFQIFFNMYILSLGIDQWLFHYSYQCQPTDYSMNPTAMRMARCCYWFYISKFLDWFDTLFFVLRKKKEHLSLLHLVHHGVMPFNTWLGVKFTAGGQSTFFGLLNTQIHIIMYFYYTVSAMGPEYHKYLWWKRYLTTMQIVQFVAVFVHAAQLLFIECDYPKIFTYLLMAFTLMFIGLFTDFYLKSYVQPKRKAKQDSSRVGCNGVHNWDVQNHQQTNGEGVRHRRAQPNGMCIQQAFYDDL